MKLTENQLRKVIRKTIKDNWNLVSEQSGRPAGPGYVLQALGNKSALDGRAYGVKGLEAAMNGDFIAAGTAILDALWVDDLWPEDEEALEDIIQNANVQTMEDLAAAGSEWLDEFRKGGWHDHSQPYPEKGLKSLYTRPR